MAMFTGFKPQGLQKIASKMGYAGRMEEFDQYLQQNPDKQREMIVYQGKAQEMAKGGMVKKMAVGGTTTATNCNTHSTRVELSVQQPIPIQLQVQRRVELSIHIAASSWTTSSSDSARGHSPSRTAVGSNNPCRTSP